MSLNYLLSTGRHFSAVSFITILRSNLRTALTTQNTTENNSIISQAKYASTAAQCLSYRNISVIGHKVESVGLLNRKHTPRSTPNYSVSVSTIHNGGIFDLTAKCGSSL